ncbi:unnamed protein product [Blepharisma stoltei]|uniref:Protein SPT2 homolog n=1 Tax=Blepharisma stoltei TaxID=1481888 RepID=A0AAU9J4F7_9CILI|nr:unnamed protein product [Blepharisma stoltei]
MHSIKHGLALKELNPRAVPEEQDIPLRLKKLLESNKPKKSAELPKKFIQTQAKPAKPQEVKKSEKPKAESPKQVTDLYKKQLEYSRNYEAYMSESKQGFTKDDLFDIPKKSSANIPEKPKPDPKPQKDVDALIALAIQKKKKRTNEKGIKLKHGQGLLNGYMIWCARCSKNHPSDFHQKAKTIKSTSTPALPIKRDRLEAPIISKQKVSSPVDEYSYEEEEEYENEDEESDLDGFIERDDYQNNVSKIVRKMYNYDPTKYRDIDRLPTRDMEVGAERIFREEDYSAKIGRYEDRKEFEKLKRRY